MADKTKITEWVKVPAYILAAITAIGVLMGALGFGWSTPGEKWTAHDAEHGVLSDTIREIDGHLHEQKTLIEALVKGECLESYSDKIVLQGLAETCTDLGVARSAGDAIDLMLSGN